MADTSAFDVERAEIFGRVPHGFFGHSGGAHQFGYGGPGGPAAVAEARARAADVLVVGGRVVTPHQVHSPDVVTVTKPWEDSPGGRPEADAVVTAEPGIVLGIVTADCGPVLLADERAGVVGAAHAGWRGAHGSVLENTIVAMENLGATRGNIAAAIGPTIAQASYEVDAPFRAQFTSSDDMHFVSAPERDGSARWQFDLPSYIAEKLRISGLVEICDLGRDTFENADRYYSYRRAVSNNEPNYGRQISLIGLD